MDITLKVSPEVLRDKANSILAEKSTIANLLDEAKTSVSSLTGTWKSEAADEYQNRFKQIYDDIDKLLAVVNEYGTDLTEAASIYSAAETAAKSAAEGLPVDGVF